MDLQNRKKNTIVNKIITLPEKKCFFVFLKQKRFKIALTAFPLCIHSFNQLHGVVCIVYCIKRSLFSVIIFHFVGWCSMLSDASLSYIFQFFFFRCSQFVMADNRQNLFIIFFLLLLSIQFNIGSLMALVNSLSISINSNTNNGN